MSSGIPDFYTAGRRSTVNMMNPGSYNYNYITNNLSPRTQQQFPLPSPLGGLAPDPGAQIHRPDLIRKRSIAEFFQQQQQQHGFLQNQQGGLGFYPRNVKPRPNSYIPQQHASPISTLPTVDFPSVSQEVSSGSNSVISRYGAPVLQQQRPQLLTTPNRNVNLGARIGYGVGISGPAPTQEAENSMIMNHRLQELEKELLGDEEDGGEGVSVVTNSEWEAETIQNLICPTQKPASLSPTSSSSSSCQSTLASPPLPCPKQSLIDAAVAISEGKPEVATNILTLLQQVGNTRGTAEQRLTAYMVSALNSRVTTCNIDLPVVSEIYGKEHAVSTQMLYNVSPCFKLGFMAANLAILEAASEQGFRKIHVVDFEVGQGGQYVHLLHALAATKNNALIVTVFTDSGEDNNLSTVAEGLRALASRVSVPFEFRIKNSKKIDELSRENLEVNSDEALAVNFAFKLYKLPDESVTTDNLRDTLLRRVRGLSPTVITVVEQELNGNTAPLVGRVREGVDYYGTLFESLNATMSRDSPERVRIEEGLGRRVGNTMACEGRDRVERCEVFGKWRARMSMAGFRARPISKMAVESLGSKLHSGTRGNPGFTVGEMSGGVGFGWMGRTLTVASAWS